MEIEFNKEEVRKKIIAIRNDWSNPQTWKQIYKGIGIHPDTFKRFMTSEQPIDHVTKMKLLKYVNEQGK